MWFLYALLATVGFGFRSLFGRRNKDTFFSCVPTPLIGMTVILVYYWYGLVFLKTGVDPLTAPIIVFSIALALWFGFSERKQLLKHVQGSLAQGVALSLSTFIFLVQWRRVLSDGFMTSLTGNMDIIVYAQVAEHMGQNSFDSVGRIGGLDSGYRMKIDWTGAFEFTAFARSAMSASFNDTLLPVLGVVFLLVAHALTLLLRNSTKLNGSTIGFLAVVPQSVFMVAYLGGSYFLAQLMGTAIFISLVTVAIKMQLQDFRFRDVIGPKTVIGGLLFSSLFLTYPHMGFVLVPILGSFLIWRLPVRESVFRLGALFSMAAFGTILVIGRMTPALEIFGRVVANPDTVGWSLPGFLPSQLIGLQWSERIPPTNQDWILSGILILAFVWTVLILRRRDGHTPPLLPVAPILLCSYAVVYFMSGVSYRQWKWVTFFQPLIVVAILLPIVAVFAASRSRHLKSVLITNSCLILLVGMNLWSTRPFQYSMGQISKQVNSELVNLGENPKLVNIDELNIKSGPHSGSMWPALYLAPRRINILDISYYTSAEPLSAPTLVRNDFSLHETVPADEISSEFKLVQYPGGLNSKDIQGLASRTTINCPTLKVIVGQVVTCDLELTNVGDGTWLGSGNFQGAVTVGIRIVDPVTRKPISEMARASLPGFPNYVSPGVTVRIQFNVSFDNVGTVLIEITPVSEFVAWFVDLNSSNASYLEFTISQ